ncbi:MAG: FMN-binding protein [Enterocloster aldenensis]
MEQQSLEADAITSATYSSDTIRKAIENALRQGEQE